MRDRPYPDPMDTVVLALVGVAVLGIVVKLSSSARSERKLVMARLAEEDDIRGAMPTEQLFRAATPLAPAPTSVPAPVAPTPVVAPEPLGTAIAAPSSDSSDATGTTHDIGTFFAGIRLPSGLVPWTGAPVSETEASFTTMTPAPEVLTELAIELARLGMSVAWEAGSVESARAVAPGHTAGAYLHRGGHTAVVTVYCSANQALGDDGAQLFKGLLAGTTLVRLSL